MTDRNGWCTGQDVRLPLEAFSRMSTGSEWVDVDPCSNLRSKVKALTCWTEETAKMAGAPIGTRRKKGLEVEIVLPHPVWSTGNGYTGFLNWPFSDPLPWAVAAGLHCDGSRSPDRCEARWLVGLGICDPTTRWWAELESAASYVCFPRDRLRYEPPPGVQESQNDRPSAVWLLQGRHMPEAVRAHDAWAFCCSFSALGRVRPS